jgi:hypothetical protein
MYEKPPLGEVPKLEPEGVCLSGLFYELYHGEDGMKWDNYKQEFVVCPYCITFMPNRN